jgi:type VI protein secretion system component Hcp
MKALVASLALFVVSQVPASAALNAYVTMSGQKTGQINGQTTNGQIAALNFACTAISSNELSTGQMVTGHRKWAPVVITISDPKATSGLQTAANSKDPISLKWWHDSDSIGSPLFSISFTGVNITGIKTLTVGNQTQQQITFTFTTITWVKGGETSHDSWNGGVGG